ncbi:MAG: ABC transporter ATP-binding protein [Candidatus Peregrinibacteria bacterium]
MISLRNASKVYHQSGEDITLFRNISFVVETGKKVAIIGPSGSGKTTLLSLLAGLEPPTEGTLFWGESDFFALPETEKNNIRRHEMGFVFQNFELFDSFTALENVLLPLELLGTVEEKKAAMMIAAVGIEHRKNAYPTEMSGGEQQRVAIARALVHHPKVIFADEPTGNLDKNTAKKVLDLLVDTLSPEQSLIMITHDTTATERMDEIWSIEDERLIRI